MKNFLKLLLVVLTIIGISDAGVLSYNEFQHLLPACEVGSDCGVVLTSKYAYILGIPIAYFGLVYYLTMFLLSVLFFLDQEIMQLLGIKQFLTTKKIIFRYVKTLDLMLIFSTIGLIFSIYLIYTMGFVIGSWCRYCLLSALSSTLIFVIAMTCQHKFGKNSSIFIKSLWYPVVSFVYTKIIKPIFFQFDAERIHTTLVSFGSIMASNKFTSWVLQQKLGFIHQTNQIKFNQISFPNRVGLAAGFDYQADLTQALPQIGFGWHTIGTITYQSYEGNEHPRLGRFPDSKSLLVNKGLKNLGARTTIAKLKKFPLHIPTGISIASTNKHFNSDREQIIDILKCFALFERSGLSHKYYELNISCPNTFGGEPYTTPTRLKLLLDALDKLEIKRPIFVKMPIDQNEKESLALLKVIDQHRIDGVIMGNLTKDKTNPAVTKQDTEAWEVLAGNLSGKPTFDRSNRLIALTKKHYGDRFTIVGTGGVFSPQDAQVKIKLGADLIQLITGMIYEGPQLIGQINLELAKQNIEKQETK